MNHYATITVIGRDKTGVVARITSFLFEASANIEGLEEQVARGQFSMTIQASWRAGHLNARGLRSGLKKLAAELGMDFRRSESLNASPLLIQAQADIVASHLRRGEVCTPQYRMNCASCVNPTCRTILNPVGGQYQRLRDLAKGVETPTTAAELR